MKGLVETDSMKKPEVNGETVPLRKYLKEGV
jgi:hypothetical protein